MEKSSYFISDLEDAKKELIYDLNEEIRTYKRKNIINLINNKFKLINFSQKDDGIYISKEPIIDRYFIKRHLDDSMIEVPSKPKG